MYDPLDFHSYLETIVASNTPSSNTLFSQKEQPPWLTTDAAHTIITAARRRCYVENPLPSGKQNSNDSHDAEWEVLNELEGISIRSREGRPSWLPPNLEPILEEPPKWSLLTDILSEIEQLMNDNPVALGKSSRLT